MGPISIGVEVQRNTDGDTPSTMTEHLHHLTIGSVDGLHLRMPMVFKKIKVGQLSYNAQFSFSVLSTL